MSAGKIKVLCVGMDNDWIQAWGKHPASTVAGIVDLYREGKQGGEIPVYSHMEEAMDAVKPDLVTMVVPPSKKTELQTVKTILGHGYDVYMQKLRPAGRDDGDMLLAMAEASGKEIAIGETYRYDPVIQTARAMIERGELGVVEEVYWECRRHNIDSDWTQAYRHLMIEDLSYHHLGAIAAMCGQRFEQVYAWSAEPSWSHRAHSVASMMLKGAEGLRVSYTASWAASGDVTPWLGDFRVEGSRGSLVYEKDQMMFWPRDGAAPREVSRETERLRGSMVEAYLDAHRTGERSELDIRTQIPILRTIAAALQSAEEDRVIKLDS